MNDGTKAAAAALSDFPVDEDMLGVLLLLLVLVVVLLAGAAAVAAGGAAAAGASALESAAPERSFVSVSAILRASPVCQCRCCCGRCSWCWL